LINQFGNFKGYKPQHKFSAKQVKHEGENFASKLEFAYKKHLDLMQKAGEVVFYLTQVPIRLPGGTKYVVDFLVFNSDNSVHFIDTKGVETDTFKIKKREIEALYPFEIDIVKRGDF
jgi:hypothetical protein